MENVGVCLIVSLIILVPVFYLLFVELPDYWVNNEERLLREALRQALSVKNILLFPFLKLLELPDIWERIQDYLS